MIDIDAKKKARRRALRAAQAVTLGLAIATGGAGCFGAHGRDRSPAPPPEDADVARADGSVADPDAGFVSDSGPGPRDAGFHEPDAALADAALADAGIDGGDMMICDASGDWMEFQECCNANGWNPEWGCFAWGPFVPPAERAHLQAA